MLGWFILGVCVLAALLLGARWFVNADPKLLARLVKWLGIGLLAILAVALVLTRNLGLLMTAAFVALMLLRRRGLLFRMGGGRPSGGQRSEVESTYVAMTLDHDTGVIEGRVLSGRHAGRDLADLDLDELLELLAECQLHDEEGARLVETYIDRTQAADWRERAAAGGAGGRGARPGGARMSAEEAYEILGLEPGATPEQIKEAHRRLMQKIHPDHGGSSFLAAKINQAKEVLLGT